MYIKFANRKKSILPPVEENVQKGRSGVPGIRVYGGNPEPDSQQVRLRLRSDLFPGRQ